MKLSGEIFHKLPYFFEELWVWIRLHFSLSGINKHKQVWLAAIFAFGISLFFIFLTLERQAQIHYLKNGLLKTEQNLNEFGWDISYDYLHFSPIFTEPLFTARNFAVYNPTKQINFKIPEMELTGSLLNLSLFTLELGKKQELRIGAQTYPIKTEDTNLEIKIKKDKIETILAEINNIDIKNFAKINNINLAGRQSDARINLSGPAASFEHHIEAKGVTLNGLLNYPLNNKIDRLYFKTNLLGKIMPSDTLHHSLQNWLQGNGSIAVTAFVVNWPPFSMIGKGSLNFDEKLQPNLLLNTSSKALLNLLDDMQEKGIIERKNLFVANILLNNKAFKLKENDEHLTIVTPLGYRDNQITLENVAIHKF